MYKINFKKFENTDKFRPAAIHFQQHGEYTSAPRGTTAYREYWDEERKRCLYGYTADDGEHITGYHYFYLNYCPIVLVKEKGKAPLKDLPRFYDFDKYFFDVIEECETQGKHLAVLKARRKGYSYKIASMLIRNYYFIPNSKGIAAASKSEFLVRDGILTKTWDYMDYIDEHTAWGKKRQKIDTKMHKRASLVMDKGDGIKVEVGYKSEIIGVTLGNDPHALRGKMAKLIIFEEGGHFPNLKETWQVTRPSMEQGSITHGLCIVFGTGGSDAEDFEGLKDIYYEPDAYGCLEIENVWEEESVGKPAGFFVPYTANLDGLDDSGNLFMDDQGNSLISECKEYILKERRTVIDNATDRTMIDRFVAERALTPSEATLNISTNIFPKEEMLRHLSSIRNSTKLKEEKQVGDLMFDGNGKIIWVPTSKPKDLMKYRLEKDMSRVGQVVIWEHPIDNPPYGLYIAGCLLPGEKVLTEKGLMNVENVTTEKLLDKDGKLVNIKALLRYDKKDEEVYTIKMANTYRTTTFTKEHPIYVSSHNLNKQDLVKENLFNFDFKKVSEINKTDWVKYPNFYLNEDIDYEEDPVAIGEYNSDHWWFQGLWLGDGWCNKNSIYIAFDVTNIKQFNRYKEYVKKYYSKELHVRQRENTIECSFTNKYLVSLLTDTYGKYASGKRIPEWIKYEKNKIKENLLLGFLDSDGCICKNSKGYYSMEFVSINLELLESFQDIAFSLGLVGGVTKLRNKGIYNINGRTGQQNEAYHLRFAHYDTLNFANRHGFREDSKLEKIDKNNTKKLRSRPKTGCFLSKDLKYIYFQIKNITKDIYTGVVYNFETDTHTFCAYHIPTHNCDPIDHDKSTTNSLFSIFIYKRFSTISDTGRIVVAEYTGRPEFATDAYEEARKLAIYYNATILYENQCKGMFPYFTSKHCDYLLADQPEIIRDIVKNSQVQRAKGIHMHQEIKMWMETKIRDWLNEEMAPGIKRLTSIKSEPLLEELIAYNDTSNFDRVISFGLCLIYEEELFRIIVKKHRKDVNDRLIFKEPIFQQNNFKF